MIQAEVKPPLQLTGDEIDAWQAWRRAEPAFANPLLGPDFAQAVGLARDDARVALFRRDGRLVGALAFHRRPNGFARPIGAAFSDYHALITAPGERIDGREALEAAGIGAIAFTGLIDPAGAFPAIRPSEHLGYVIDLQGSVEAHYEALKAANPKRFKNWRRLQNKLEREIGEVVLTPGDVSQEAFDALIGWKRDQYRRTGVHDVLRSDWARALFQDLFERRTGELRGVMTTLRAGGRVVAGKFGVAQDGVWHSWISSIDPDCTACAPGLVLMLRAPETLAALGLRSCDLGPSYAHYKEGFSPRQFAVGDGLALAEGPASRTARSLDRAWVLAGDGRVAAVGRLRRRLDHIAAAEPSLGGRVRGVVEALAGYSRRSSSREPVREVAADAAGDGQ
jgi:CelD/BcsL family acetyltransferase involved in cellulose biosynthesis